MFHACHNTGQWTFRKYVISFHQVLHRLLIFDLDNLVSLKLAGVGFVSSIGAGVAWDVLYAARRVLSPTSIEAERVRAPIWKAASVYSGFLGTLANLRYQVIAGLVEHRLGDYLVSYYNQPFLANVLSFVARIINSYFGTQLFQRSLELHNLSRDETINQLRCIT